MKKVILLALIVFSTALFAQTTTAPLKIGYVDSEVILAQFPEAIKAKSDLEGMVSKWKKEIDSMSADLQKSYADFVKQSATMKQEEKDKKQQTFVAQDQKIQQYQQSKMSQPNGEYFQKQDQLMKPIKDKIFKAIDEVSNEESMQFVFDKAGDVILLKADSQFDITYKVLDLLKRGKK
ncbi:MAG: molecular chaperone Skp [Ignavibacteriae bacterium HGW-Ignavibacteriae-3]|nr:MAG: molecular chaperone Skp [Ignavibacteriae bacterium HGW-Ignavibacteriae-3]